MSGVKVAEGSAKRFLTPERLRALLDEHGSLRDIPPLVLAEYGMVPQSEVSGMGASGFRNENCDPLPSRVESASARRAARRERVLRAKGRLPMLRRSPSAYVTDPHLMPTATDTDDLAEIGIRARMDPESMLVE